VIEVSFFAKLLKFLLFSGAQLFLMDFKNQLNFILMLSLVIFTAQISTLPYSLSSPLKVERNVMKRSTSNLSNIIFGRRQVSCREILICGLAIYDNSHVIIRKRKNNLCFCDEGYKCVLTYNLLDRHAYIFQCREESITANMYEFPP